MAIAQLKRWLNSNRDFDTGKQLYAQLGDGSLKPLLSHETTFSRKKLYEALQAVFDKVQPPRKSPEAETTKAKQHLDRSRFQSKDYFPRVFPEPLQRKDESRKKLFAEAAELRRQLRSLPSPEQRKPLIDRIKKIFNDDLEAIWFEFKFFKNTGEILTEEEKDLNMNQIHRKLMNARTHVSRYTGVPEKEHLLEKWEAERSKYQALYDEFIRRG